MILKTVSISLLASLALLASGPLWAQQETTMPGQAGEHRGPPPAAIDACKSLAADAACSFTDKKGNEHDGVCRAPQDQPLACVPPHHRRPREGAADQSPPPPPPPKTQ